MLGIVFFHELGHIMFIKHYHYTITKVEIFPFGGMTTVEKKINTPLKQELWISLGGVLFQGFLFFFFFVLWHNQFILENTYQLFLNYNKVILLFNLLPISPLDGSIIVHTILEYFLSYEKAYKCYFLCSVITFLLFLTFHTIKSLNNYMIVTFLLFKIIEAYQKRKYYQNKFYLERYLYELPYRKMKSHSKIELEKLKKDTLHFFWRKDRYVHEKEVLKQKYKCS